MRMRYNVDKQSLGACLSMRFEQPPRGLLLNRTRWTNGVSNCQGGHLDQDIAGRETNRWTLAFPPTPMDFSHRNALPADSNSRSFLVKVAKSQSPTALTADSRGTIVGGLNRKRTIFRMWPQMLYLVLKSGNLSKV